MAREPDKNRSSVDHEGRSKAFAAPGERTLAIHHDPNVARRGDMPDATAHLTGHRGHPTGGVVDGRTARAPGALDIQPRAGKPKAMHPVAIHNGMTARSRDGGVHLGGDALSRATANPANPIGGAPRGKTFSPAQPVPGQRSRTSDTLHGGQPGENHTKGKPNIKAMSDLGRAVLAEALANSAPDDRSAHYGIGALPEATNEN